MKGKFATARSLIAFILLAATASPSVRADTSESPGTSPDPAERGLFFGDLHVHSSWSLDAYMAGVSAPPLDAYRYARGEAIRHLSGETIRLQGPPLDFLALTEHAEYLGVLQAANQPGHPLQQQPLIQTWKSSDPMARKLAQARIHGTYSRQQGLPALVSDVVVQPAWNALVRLAALQNQPGTFTTFIAFEYSSAIEGRNLHRNVVFRGAEAPIRPFSAMDSNNPEDLWRWMDEQRAEGRDALAIPHNSNGSDGWMFAKQAWQGTPIDPEWIALRARNEPLVEILQIKGQSETHPTLSPEDPWAEFAVIDVRTLWPNLASQPPGSYWRNALRTGLDLETRFEANPYRFGVVGSTDGHNAASPFEENNYSGKIGRTDATPASRLAPVDRGPGLEPGVALSTRWGSAAGLAGVWADANEREALFDAMRRRETFGTSGPRIRLRFFAGWQFSEADALGDHAAVGYRKGVPMGGVLELPTLPEKPLTGTDPVEAPAPVLLVRAQQDPNSAGLERLQIIKGWARDGETFERVFDVACMGGDSPDPVRARCSAQAPAPDLPACQPSASGAAELSARWRDPDYDPDDSVFYYVRVLEVPTCRWSTRDAIRLNQPPPRGVPVSIQERAIASPVWVPARDRRDPLADSVDEAG